MSQEPKRTKHTYTTELELKCLIIRINNKKKGIISTDYNSKINRYVKLHEKLKNKKYKDDQQHEKRKRIVKALKSRAVRLSEITLIDNRSYNLFGEKVLLMIKKILTKPCFSGYTFRDEFYSDAVHKILKYMHNFDHKMISTRSGIEANAFAYITQIIINSILFIINTKNKEQKEIQKQVRFNNLDHELNMKSDEIKNDSKFVTNFEKQDSKVIEIDEIKTSLYETIKELNVSNCTILYPEDYKISMLEYNDLKTLNRVSIMRKK